MALCKECDRDFPADLLQDLVTEKGRRKMCPICALTARNRAAGLPPGTPFQGPNARALHAAALEHLARGKAVEN